MTDLQQRDQQYLWHPLTQHQRHPVMLPIKRAKGALLYDEADKAYIDGIASWYTCMYGHCHPEIIEAITQQLHKLDHVVFTGFTHEPAIELSELLMEILPANQQKIFFSDNGSTSIDVAIKMALQYHFNNGRKKSLILALEDGFHGDTFGAMSVSGLSVYNGPFEDFFIDVKRIPVPNAENIESLKVQLLDLIATHDIAALVYEPLVQGAAGMKIHSGVFLNEILQITKANGILNIADEVMTGFGKTGTPFASEQIVTKPDIICLSKSLTAGVAPMGLTTCTQQVYDAFLDNQLSKGFFHGHTYSANPLACTAAIAGIKLLGSDQIQENIRHIMDQHTVFAQKIQTHPMVKNVRQLGVIFALDIDIPMDRYGNLRDRLFNFYMKNGVLLRPLGNIVYILPPFIIKKEELEKIYQVIEASLVMIEENAALSNAG